MSKPLLRENRIMSVADFRLTANQDAVAIQHGLGPLPRSIVRSNVYELLDGPWRFELDLNDRGLADRWYLAHEFSQTTMWPGSIESQMAKAQDAQHLTPPWQDTVIAWYERELSIPAHWCST